MNIGAVKKGLVEYSMMLNNSIIVGDIDSFGLIYFVLKSSLTIDGFIYNSKNEEFNGKVSGIVSNIKSCDDPASIMEGMLLSIKIDIKAYIKKIESEDVTVDVAEFGILTHEVKNT